MFLVVTPEKRSNLERFDGASSQQGAPAFRVTLLCCSLMISSSLNNVRTPRLIISSLFPAPVMTNVRPSECTQLLFLFFPALPGALLPGLFDDGILSGLFPPSLKNKAPFK